jgi:integrase
MSRKVQAIHSITVANSKLGGARITKVQRKRTCKDFINWCFQRQHIFNSIADVNATMIRDYIEFLKNDGISIATQHNRLASIRVAMTALGKNPDELCITTKTVGLEPRSRVGTKEPIPDAMLEIAISKANELNEQGFAIALRLQRLLGLRGLESLMSIYDLEKYALEASELVNQGVRITKGTKGGRPRFTDVILARANETLWTIQEALIYMSAHGGYLIDSGKGGLKSARSKYHSLAAQVGLVGKYAPHSLRYAFATEKIAELRGLGYNRQEAMVLIAKYLGHGPSRARYISSVYGQTIVHTLPIEQRKSKLNRAILNLDKLILK